MRFLNILTISLAMLVSFNLYAATQETNVNVTLKTESENRFEPFPEPSEGLQGLVDTGVLRVIEESDPGLAKYAALNQAMQKARRKVWAVIEGSYITGDMTVKDAVLAAPPYYEFKPRDDSEKDKLDAMTPADRDAYIKEHGKERKYDLDKLIDTIKECGKYDDSGRFYDSVEKKGYICLQVKLDDYMNALDNDKIDIFKNLSYGDRYSPVDSSGRAKYDAIIVNAEDTNYVPSLRVKILSPTEETIYAGVAGKKKIFFASSIDEAKKILAPMGVRRAYNAKSAGETGKIGLRVSLPSADRIYSAVKNDSGIPFVIIYKKQIPDETAVSDGTAKPEETPTPGE